MPDDYLTVDEVASQLALPLEMIQRRIESGDIPVHWVEIGGKLEMRISAAEIGVEESGAAPTPFPAPSGFTEMAPETEEEIAPSNWSVREPDYSPDVWTPPEGDLPEASVPPAPPSWEAEPSAELPEVAPEPTSELPEVAPEPTSELPEAAPEPTSELPEAAPEPTSEPVWRPDPGTWEDEPIDAGEATPELSPFSPAGTDAYFPAEEAVAEPEAPPPPASSPFAAAAEPLEEEGGSPFGAGEADEGDEEELAVADEGLDFESPPPREVVGVTEIAEVPRPSALAASQGADSSLALNSIDARELVAGLFERWERALEQRIQAEQRLRFEAELERRLRQVRDLRQELENTRKSTAAQLAEREQEVMALRSRLRDQGPPSKGRGLFRR
ncbi:MAG: hypothetical protein ACRENY_02015 [Candidatus Dormibacteria bacterium]